MNYWRLVTHDRNPELALEEYRRRNLIALGWGPVGHLSAWQPDSHETIQTAIQNIPNFVSPASAVSGGQCLWYFYHEMQVGDLVILSIGQGPLQDVVEVTGNYEWIPTPVFPGGDLFQNDYHHIRRVRWRTDLDGRQLWNTLNPPPFTRRALIQLQAAT